MAEFLTSLKGQRLLSNGILCRVFAAPLTAFGVVSGVVYAYFLDLYTAPYLVTAHLADPLLNHSSSDTYLSGS